MKIKVHSSNLDSKDHYKLANVSIDQGVSEQSLCYFCAGKARVIGRVKYKNTTFLETSRCVTCGAVWKSKRPKSVSLPDHFEEGWLSGKQLDFVAKKSPYNILSGYLHPDFKILDVGCGNGDRMDGFQTSGADVMGCDPNLARIQDAKSRGLNVVQSFAESYLRQNQVKFDLIYAYNVLQFVDNPKVALDLFVDNISDRGLIYLKLGRYYKEADPLVYTLQNVMGNGTSLKTATLYLNKLGFSLVKMDKTMTWGVYSRKSNFLTLLLEKLISDDGKKLEQRIFKFQKKLSNGISVHTADKYRSFKLEKLNQEIGILDIEQNQSPFVLMK